MSVTLIGGPRHGQVISPPDGTKFVAVPVLSDDRRWIHTSTYDGLSGQWLRDSEPEPMPPLSIDPCWDDDYEPEEVGRFARIRRAIGLRIAGLTEDDLYGDDGDW